MHSCAQTCASTTAAAAAALALAVHPLCQFPTNDSLCGSLQTLTKAKWVTLSLLSLAAVSLLNVVVPESADATTISAQLSGTLFTLNLFSAVQVSFTVLSLSPQWRAFSVTPINHIGQLMSHVELEDRHLCSNR